MTQQNTQNEPIIRITVDEANSEHVSDMLKRQASLRGEGGIAREKGGAWYYQNWLILMIAGALGALIGWSLIEPVGGLMGEFYRVDARITIVGAAAPAPHARQNPQVSLQRRPMAVAEVPDGQGGTELVYIYDGAKKLAVNGKAIKLTESDLQVGQVVRVHAMHELVEDLGEHFFFAEFVEFGAPPLIDQMDASTWVKRHTVGALLLFPVVAALVGLLIGAADGLMCRLVRRALLAGLVGLVVGFIGAFVSIFIAGMVYMPLRHLAGKHTDVSGGLTAMGYLIQIGGRGLAWCLAGMTVGLGQGLALRSTRLLLYGFLGGLVGGLFGGLFFDPINLLILGQDKHSGAWLARMIGFLVIGATVGFMIGIVERLARDAWLRMIEGPLAGKEFLVFKDLMRMGSSPRSEIYLFNDEMVAPDHAILRSTGDTYEIESCAAQCPVLINGIPVQRARLRHGDRISLGQTSFVFQRQRGE